jgi:CRP-like cAMP-binding protein
LLASLDASGVPIIERCYSPSEHPYMRGDPDEGLWFLLEGTLEVCKLYGAFREATVRLIDGEGLFGELSVRSTGYHRDSAQAISACRVAKVPKSLLQRHLRRIQVAPPRCLAPSPSAPRSAKLWWNDCSIGR